MLWMHLNLIKTNLFVHYNVNLGTYISEKVEKV